MYRLGGPFAFSSVAVFLGLVLAATLGTAGCGALTGRRSGVAHAGARPITVSPRRTPGPSAVSGGLTWTAVGGPTCGSGAARFTEDGYYTRTSNGQSTGWITSGSGGYRGDGCAGGFVSIPLSGQAGAYDSNRFALWTFRLGAEFTHASCVLATFVPYNPQLVYVGGDPAYYFYYGTDYSSGSAARPLGGYRVDQTATRGDWVRSRSFAIKTGWVAVKLVDAGANQTRATLNSHAAAAQLRLTCHAA